ncbi:CRAL-TRIO domain-containing protein [Apiospora marii]|uniref:CRAL-TRIO domain-containing protein n=1 Tax=Apiospora marii TaxID=335849 RepID=UPI00312FC307
MDQLEGRVGHLTPQQESKLAEMWAVMLKKCGTNEESPGVSNALGDDPPPKKERPAAKADPAHRKPHKGGAAADARPATADAAETPLTQDETRTALWSMVQVEHPDALLLRFLRARKWDVERAVAMLVATLRWRAKTVHVEQVLREGEGLAREQELSSQDGEAQKRGREFMFQMRAGKCVVRGVDRSGRPLCIVRVRQHFSRDQSEEVLKRWVVYIIETARLAFTPPCDTAAVIFDLTGFGLGNLDYVPVKFIIQCFEANYPEMLGKVIVHKAPWFFPGIWKLVSTWIADPVIASKICFTTNTKELGQHVDPDRLPRELGGKDPWEYAYLEPGPDENATMREAGERDRLLAEREALAREFEQATRQWVGANSKADGGGDVKQRRNELAAKINQENYWQLDPYIRARTLWDRLGIRTPDGQLNYYPEKTANGKIS